MVNRYIKISFQDYKNVVNFVEENNTDIGIICTGKEVAQVSKTNPMGTRDNFFVSAVRIFFNTVNAAL